MNALELKAECVRKEISLETLATKIGINPASLYRKMSGKSDFMCGEIEKIANVLQLNDAQLLSIFFARRSA